MFAWIGDWGRSPGPGEVGFGLFEVAQVSMNDAAIVVGDRVVRRHRQRRVRVLESSIKLAEPDPGEAAVAKQCRRIGRIEVEGRATGRRWRLGSRLGPAAACPLGTRDPRCQATARLPRVERRSMASIDASALDIVPEGTEHDGPVVVGGSQTGVLPQRLVDMHDGACWVAGQKACHALVVGVDG